MPNKSRFFGWQPDLPDHRDFMYAVPRAVLTTLPPSVDFEHRLPELGAPEA